MIPTETTGPEAPESLPVNTSQGQLTIHRMSWDRWKWLKTQALAILKQPAIQKAIEGGFAAAVAAGAGQLADAATEVFSKGLPDAAATLLAVIDDATEVVVADCVRGDLPDRLTAADMLRLREAVLTVNSPAELLGMEKNSLAGVMPTMEAPAESSQTDGGETPSSPNPTSSSKPTSSTPAGAEPTS